MKLKHCSDGHPVTKKIPVNLFRVDGGTQARATTDPAIIDEYTAAMTTGAAFPPVDAFFDGTWYWPSDGEHRIRAATTAGLKTLKAHVRPGTQRDAQFAALAANNAHGLRRTNADKRTAVLRMLRDEEWSRWSDRAVAEHIGVSHTLVANLREEIFSKDEQVVATVATPNENSESFVPSAKRIGRDGHMHPATQPRRQEQEPAEDAAIVFRRRTKDLVSAGFHAFLTGAEITLAEVDWQNLCALSDENVRRLEVIMQADQFELEDALNAVLRENVGELLPVGAPHETAKPTAPEPDLEEQEQAATLNAALARIDAVLGGEYRAALLDGRIQLSGSRVLAYAALDDAELQTAATALQAGWDVARYRRVYCGQIDDRTTVADLKNKLITMGGAYHFTIGAVHIQVEPTASAQQVA